MKLTFPLLPIQFQLSLKEYMISWTRGPHSMRKIARWGREPIKNRLARQKSERIGPVPSSSVSWRVSICLGFYHITSLYFISLMRSLPFGFHFVIEQLNYNVTSNFAVQCEGGKKQNGFSQWGLVDASQ